MIVATCEACGGPLRPRSRRWCSEACRKAFARGSARLSVTVSALPTSTAVADAVRAELEPAGRLQTVAGAAALALAERIDASTAVMGFAALVKELRSAMNAALAGVKAANDPLDELRRRRERKLGKS